MGPKNKRKRISLFRISSIAAALLVGFGILWYLDHRNSGPAENAIAINTVAPAPTINKVPPAHTDQVLEDKKATLQKPVIADKPITKKATAPVSVADERAPMANPGKAEEMSVPSGQAAPPAIAMKEKSIAARAVADTVSGHMSSGYAASYTPSAPLQKDAYSMSSPKFNVNPAPKAFSTTTPKLHSIASRKMTEEKKQAQAEDHLEQGAALADQNKYGTALAQYNKAMNTGDRSSRTEAAIGAAQCYQHLGNKQKAISLLQQVVNNESGPQKRRARRLLRQLQRD